MNNRIVFALILLLVSSQISARETLKLGYVPYSPLVFAGSGGQPTGEPIDVIERTLSAEFKVEWVKLPIGRVRWGLENGLIDAFAYYNYSPEREAYAQYPTKPVLTIQAVLCSKLLRGKNIVSETELFELLQGKAVISPLNSITFPYSEDTRIRHIKIPYENYGKRGLSLLAESRADFIFFPVGSTFSEQISDIGLACADVGQAQPTYMVFSRGHPHAERVEALFEPVDTLRY